ncbi:MAG: hypothetical protein WCC03_11520 [Candidatus Acidiferrales bacterium]
MLKSIISALSKSLGLAALLACLLSSRAYGDVGVILNETLNESVARVTGSGHTAVYFSRICPDSPIKLRLCRPGENGSVMSNYINLGEDERYEWNIAPLNLYAYGVEDPADRPLFGTDKIKAVLEERYREQALASYCTVKDCLKGDKAEWREMVGANMIRSMYIFVVETTVQQDEELIAKFNALPNENHFNGMTRNCADFTKNVIDTYFPHSAHRDVINDFGMTSPKAVARTFSHYAQEHPESNFRVLHFSQLPGTIKRSTEPRSGTEQLFRSKKLLIPMVIFADHELPVVAAAYLITGRFNPEREFEQHATVEPVQLNNSEPLPKTDGANNTSAALAPVEIREREEVVGAPGEWEKYRKSFDTMVNQAVQDEMIPDRGYVARIFKRLDSSGRPIADTDGSLWLEISSANGASKVGLSRNNIFAPGSDPHLAFELLLARVDAILRSPKHSRETMIEFKEDWALLEYARMRITPSAPLADSSSSQGAVAAAASTGQK